MNAESVTMQAAPESKRALTWAERNQQWLVREMGKLAQRIDARRDSDHNDGLDTSLAPLETPQDLADNFVPALRRVTEVFGLSEFERDVLLLIAGTALDSRLRRAIAAVRHGSPRATFALALDRLPNAHWDALSPDRPLRYWRLITVEAGAPLTEATLGIDERVLHYLTGVGCSDERLRGVVHRVAPITEPGSLSQHWIESVALALQAPRARPALVAFDRDERTPPGDDKRLLVETLAHLGFDALLTFACDLPSDPGEVIESARALDREAVLSHAVAVLILDALGERSHDHERRAASLIAAMRGPAFLLGHASRELIAAWPGRQIRRLKLPVSDPLHARAGRNDALGRALQSAMQQFHVSRTTVDDALSTIDPGIHDNQRDVDDIVWQALREAARGGLDALAQRIESRTSFDDLVLPPAQMGVLRDITRQLRHRHRVHREWGFADISARGLGLCALFAGEPGTGKTMAAEAIANEARLDLYRIDLATVVSKYIGETEKNLRRVFDAAEASGAVLLFDEADALFGKRSEVRDSHDRYANIEVAYLLQRVEAYRGLAILTTNMKSGIDRAFLRRIRFMVPFPFPDDAARSQIWRRQFGPRTPVDRIDFAALAKLQLAGGDIRTIAVNAAFRAADQECAIGQRELLEATRAEFAKLGRPMGASAGRDSDETA